MFVVRVVDWCIVLGMFVVQCLIYGVFVVLLLVYIVVLLECFQCCVFKCGDIVICQGVFGDYYYLIEQGSCLVICDVDGDSIVLVELKLGDVFGEEVLVLDMLCNVIVMMYSDGVFLMLGKVDFDELLCEFLLWCCLLGEVMECVRQGVVWLDVCFVVEYCYDGLFKVINILFSELRLVLYLLDKCCEYIVYCQIGCCSVVVVFLFFQCGFKVVLLDGGLCVLVGLMVQKEVYMNVVVVSKEFGGFVDIGGCFVFFKNLQMVINKIYVIVDVDEIMLELLQEICMFFNVDWLMIYLFDDDKIVIVLKIKIGLNLFKDLCLFIIE